MIKIRKCFIREKKDPMNKITRLRPYFSVFIGHAMNARRTERCLPQIDITHGGR